MNRNEGRPAGPNNQDQYEATVLDFLDKEMAAAQPATKKDQQSDELDALVSDLLKQVITEADQPQQPNALVLDEDDELFSGLLDTQKAPASPAAKPVASPAQPINSASANFAPADTRIEPEIPVAKPEVTPKAEKAKAASPPAIGSTADFRNKVPLIATAAVGLILIIGGAVYYSSRSSSKAAPTAQSAATQAAKSGTQAAPAPAQPSGNAAPASTSSAKPEKSTVQNSAPASQAQKQSNSSKTPAQPAAAQQNGKPAPANSKPEPAPTAKANTTPAPVPVKEEKPVAQPVQSTPAPATVSAPVEKPAPPPEPVAPVNPPVAEKKPAAPTPAPPQVAENTAPAPQPSAAPATPTARNLIAAVLISQVSPVYPELALRTRASGTVVLDLQIDEQGKVVKATPVSGPTLFHGAAVNAALKWRYKPASIGGVNVRSQSKATMDFNLKR